MVELREHNGLLTFTDPDGLALLADCYARVALSDGTHFSTHDPLSLTDRTDQGTCIRAPCDHLRPQLRWHIAPDGDGVSFRMWVEVENTTGHPLPVERIDLLVAPSGLCCAQASQLEVMQTGWQSWSAATPPIPLADHPLTAPPPVIGPRLPPTEAERAILPWVTIVHAPAPSRSEIRRMLVGFVTAHRQAGVVTIQPGLTGHRCTASSYLEGVLLQPGATIRSEMLLLVFDRHDEEALDRYAREAAERMEARHWPHVPTGWCSWYYFFTQVTEADVLPNIGQLAVERARIPVEYIQLDDGYQQAIGDWLTLNEKFPSGMRYLTNRIRDHGFKPGIWLAPFLVSEHSEVYRNHPHWVVRDEYGQPLNAIYNWESHNYALDTTHPEVQEWLRHVIHTMVEDWGYEYLKIDFIYAGALRGRRYDPSCTGVQAYRRGLEIIRQAAGDCFILGCGAPFLPSVGMVDGMRIGSDVAPFWGEKRDPYRSAPAMLNAALCTLNRSWMHRRWWVNDPDCILVRANESRLGLAEVRSWLSLVALSGGMVLLSDDMSRLEPERSALIPLVLPPSNRWAQPMPPYYGAAPSRMRLRADFAGSGVLRVVAAMFNWSDKELSQEFDPAEWGLPPHEPYHLFDHWSGEHRGPVRGVAGPLPTPAHGVQLLSACAHTGRPQFIGSNLHLLSGVVELAAERWDEQDNTLALELTCPGEHTGEVFVYVPPEYEYRPSPSPEVGAVEWRGQLLVIPFTLTGTRTITLCFAHQGGNKEAQA
jgi:alpha-galactosidase